MYQKMISYIYEYIQEEKGANIGFVKLALQNHQYKMKVYLKNMCLDGQKLMVYGFVRKEEGLHTIPFGMVKVISGIGESLFLGNTEELSSEYRFLDMSGLLLIPEYSLTDKQKIPERFCATQWDNLPLTLQGLDLLQKEEELVHAAELKENMCRWNKEKQPIPMKKDSCWNVEKQPVMQENDSCWNMEKQPVPMKKDNCWNMGEQSVSQENDNQWNVEEQQVSGKNDYQYNREEQTDNEDENRERVENENQENEKQPIEKREESEERRVEDFDRDRNFEENAERNRNADRDRNFEENEERNRNEERDRNAEEHMPEQEESIWDLFERRRVEMQERFEKIKSTQDKEQQRTWREGERILSEYQPMCRFFDGQVLSSVRIEPKDIGAFPMEYWYLANNSFLLHGYYCYRHLLFMKLEEEKENIYAIGVPGNSHYRERFMANMFGFENFKPVQKKENAGFGYWWKRIR